MNLRTFSIAILCCCALALGVTVPSIDARPRNLPPTITAALSRRYPGWRLAVPDTDVADYYARAQNRSADELSVVCGDFDSNGDEDWAIHLLHQRGSASERVLLVYLQRGGRYWLRTLERGSPDGQFSIHMSPLGSRLYDYHRDRYFRLRHDAVFIYYFEKAGHHFIWRRNRFAIVTTSD